MTRQLFNSHSDTEKKIGYSRAVVDGDWIFIAGTTGFDYAHATIAEGVEEQVNQCVRNIRNVLREADADLRDIVSMLYVVPHPQDIEQASAALRRHFGEIRPTCMMICAGLVDPRMRIEIQTTARRGSGGQAQQFRDITLDAADH